MYVCFYITTLNPRDWDRVCEALRTYCPNLQLFERMHHMPMESYGALLQHYGSSVKAANLESFRGHKDLCRKVLDTCPNLRDPSYCCFDLDDLQLVAPRLNGALDVINTTDKKDLQICMKKLTLLSE